MIHEFAIDPDYFESIESLRSAAEGCSIHFGRVISEFPTRQWLSKVRQKLRSSSFQQTQKLLVILQDLETRGGLIDFRRPYDHQLQWVENAISEHGRDPFSAVVSRSQNTINAVPFYAEELSMHAPPWEISYDKKIQRTTTELVKALRPLLLISNDLIFIDPHLTPDTQRYQNAIKAYLAEACRIKTQWSRIEFHTWHPVKPESGAPERAAGLTRLTADCKKHLPRCIPKSMSMTIFIWDKHPNGDEMHARYVMTDKCAIHIDSGLDIGAPGTETPVRIVGKNEYKKLLSEFVTTGNHFRQVAKFKVQ